MIRGVTTRIAVTTVPIYISVRHGTGLVRSTTVPRGVRALAGAVYAGPSFRSGQKKSYM